MEEWMVEEGERMQQLCLIDQWIVWLQQLWWIFVLWHLGKPPGVFPCLTF